LLLPPQCHQPPPPTPTRLRAQGCAVGCRVPWGCGAPRADGRRLREGWDPGEGRRRGGTRPPLGGRAPRAPAAWPPGARLRPSRLSCPADDTPGPGPAPSSRPCACAWCPRHRVQASLPLQPRLLPVATLAAVLVAVSDGRSSDCAPGPLLGRQTWEGPSGCCLLRAPPSLASCLLCPRALSSRAGGCRDKHTRNGCDSSVL